MSLDPEELEAVIRNNDPARVRELLRDASEADRQSCAKALKPFLDAPVFPPIEGVVTLRDFTPSVLAQLAERAQAREEWEARRHSSAFVAAALGLVSGLAAARELEGQHWPAIFVDGKLPWIEPDGTHSYVDREPLARDLEAIAGVLADRRPPWLGSWVGGLLTGRIRFSVAPWPMARELVRLGTSRPDAPEYTTAMVSFLYAGRWGRWPDGKLEFVRRPLDGLLADPWLLEDEVWRLFEVQEAARMLTRCIGTREEALATTWEEALVTLSGQGRLDRDRLLDACIGAFLRDFAANQVGWYVRFHHRMAPTIDEVAARTGKYLALLGTNSKPGVSLGQQACGRLLEAGRLPLADFLAACPQVLLFPQKGVAISQLKLLGKVAREPSVRALALATAAGAFGHARLDVQEAALDLIGKLGVPEGAEAAIIAGHAAYLAPALASKAVGLGLLAAPPAPAAAPAGIPAGIPLTSAPPVGTPPSLEDPDELIRLLTQLMEDADDPFAIERAMAGAVRLATLPESDRKRLGSPLVKRAEQLIAGTTRRPHALSDWIARLALAWACVPCAPPAWASWKTQVVRDIPAARALEAYHAVVDGPAGAELLAEPSAADGSVHPDTLLARLATWRGAPIFRYDMEVALLRLPMVDASFWGAWDKVHPASAAQARRAHQAGTAELAFGTVVSTTTDQLQRSRIRVLARITSDPPGDADGSRCWRLLVDDLPDPLVDPHYEYRRGGVLTETGPLSPVVASWPLLCPWQPELAAAHLLRPLSACLAPDRGRAGPAAAAVMGLTRPSAPPGPVGHLALLTGLGSAEASVRIAAADVWVPAALAGRLDPDLAADALVTGVTSEAVKLTRLADGLRHASRQPASALMIARTVFASAGRLVSAKPPNLHLLLELTREIGAAIALPEPPERLVALAAGKGSTKLEAAARRLVNS
jgi:hypothetical protein